MITLQTVNATDLIDDGRAKFNANDEALADGVGALEAQIAYHDHDDVYFTKADVDAMERGSYRFLEWYVDNLLAVSFCRSSIVGLPLAGSGKLVDVQVQRTTGGSNGAGGEVDFVEGDVIRCSVHYAVSNSWASISDPLVLNSLVFWVSIESANGKEKGRIEVPFSRNTDSDQFAVVAMISQ